jgi:mRNA interferase RelE/StbE
MAYHIEITSTALKELEVINDRRIRTTIVQRIDTLADEPEKLGKPLKGWLAGYLSTRAAAQRYRIVYRIDKTNKNVLVYFIGLRREGSPKDIYALAERLVRRGLI